MTAPMNHEMECARIEDEGIALDYAAGRLDEAATEAFELHFMSCARCADLATRAQALRGEVEKSFATAARPAPSFVPMSWLRLAAVVVVGLGGVWLSVRSRETKDLPAPPSASSAVASPAPPPRLSAKGGADVWAQAAAFDMPRYSPPVMRSDEASRIAELQRAMDAYARGDWATARAGLTPLSTRGPSRAAALFFLGAIDLREGEAADALARFDSVIRLGETPYLEEASWLAAKALFAQGKADEARARLRDVVKQDGDLVSQARDLLKATEVMPTPPPTTPR
jgi:tetratricopeptide (TPR) repeat protein